MWKASGSETRQVLKLPRITLEQWAAFKAVVDEGAPSQSRRGAEQNQSSVSYAIKGWRSNYWPRCFPSRVAKQS